MSTLEEIYQQITGDDGQKAAFADAAQTEETLAKFLASLGCDATPEEVSAFLKAKAGAEDELADEELDNVAGGCNLMEGALSFMTAGIYCHGHRECRWKRA